MENKLIHISIIIAAYNEEKTIISVLKRISETKIKDINYDIVVVNDGSTDNTLSLLKNNNNLYDQLVSYEVNGGKGKAVKKGLEICKGNYVIFQDADLEYDPKDIGKFIEIFQRFSADLIIGSRVNYSEYTRSHNVFNKLGNKILTLLFNIFYNTTFTDIYSCYLCFKRDLLKVDELNSKGFDQQAEILGKVIKRGKKCYEVPISYNGRTLEEGKKIRFYHIFSVIYRIIIERIK